MRVTACVGVGINRAYAIQSDQLHARLECQQGGLPQGTPENRAYAQQVGQLWACLEG
jgi:hypothetical protein